jgi:hypothetical protein
MVGALLTGEYCVGAELCTRLRLAAAERRSNKRNRAVLAKSGGRGEVAGSRVRCCCQRRSLSGSGERATITALGGYVSCMDGINA